LAKPFCHFADSNFDALSIPVVAIEPPRFCRERRAGRPHGISAACKGLKVDLASTDADTSARMQNIWRGMASLWTAATQARSRLLRAYEVFEESKNIFAVPEK
jgi:hypothetical protein